MLRALKLFVLLTLALAANIALAATGMVDSVTGTVTMGGAPAKKGDLLKVGATVQTGPASTAVLQFADGQVVALKEETSFVIKEYRYQQGAANNSSVMSLLKGGLRYVSGLLAKANPEAMKLETPVATLGVRGTDFMAVTGSLYLSVGQGLVSASSTAGSATFAAGQLGFVSAAGVMPASIVASQLPATVASSFSQLGSIGLPAGAGGAAGTGSSTGYGGGAGGSGAGGGAGAGGAGTGGAAGSGAAAGGAAAGGVGVGAGAIAVGAVAVGAIAGIAGGGDNDGGTGTTSTATTSTH